MKKIALWGAYAQGNFGDDLMAHSFARGLSQSGCDVRVLDISNHERHGLRASDQAGETLRHADELVIGGGAFFEKWLSAKGIALSLLDKSRRRYELRMLSMAQHIRKNKIPLRLASVGSDGASRVAQLCPTRQILLNSCTDLEISVRLESDVSLVKSLTQSAMYFPDVLFAAPKIFDLNSVNKSHDKPSNILINSNNKYIEKVKLIVKEIMIQWPSANVFIMQSHHNSTDAPGYELNAADLPEAKFIEYENSQHMLSIISNMDLIVSSKLHVGLVGLALGSSFISLHGRDKVRQQLDQLGMFKECYFNDEVFNQSSLGDAINYAFKAKLSKYVDVDSHASEAIKHISSIGT